MNLKPLEQKIYSLLEKYNNLFSLLLFILILIIGFLFLLKPYLDNAKLSIGQMKDFRDITYDSKLKRLNSLDVIFSEYKNIEDMDTEKINKVIPKEITHAELFTQIEYIALRNGLFAKSLSFAEADSADHLILKRQDLAPKLGIIRVSAVITGADYNGMTKFLSDIENNVRLMDIINLSFAPVEKAMKVDLYSYYWKE